jgi:hypothetical protein
MADVFRLEDFASGQIFVRAGDFGFSRFFVRRHVMTGLHLRRFAAAGAATLCVAFIAASPSHALDAVWNFDGNLAASTGAATMSFRGDMGTANVDFFASEHLLGLPMPFGDDSGVMRFEATTPGQGLAVNLNNGGAVVRDYTMVWDLFRPGPSWNSWLPLFQTNVANADDADFFVNPGDGVGISGVYQGTVSNARSNIAWNRIAVTRTAAGELRKYVDGALVGVQTGLSAERWDIAGGRFNILADEDGESSAGYLSSFRFVDSVLGDAQIAALGGVHAGGANVPGKQIAANPAVVAPGSFTLAVVGDTQNYSTYHPAIFHQSTQWLVDNKAARNIQFVVQDGDIVNNDLTGEWDVARAAMDRLNGNIPYAVVRGNHDIGSQFDFTNRFGPGSPYSQQPTLADHYEVPGQPNFDMRNTVHKFEANGQKLMVVTIDISAGADVVAWANGVVSANPDYRVIVDTHAYMYDGGQRFNNAPDPEHPGLSFDRARDVLLRTGTDPDSPYNGAAYGGQDAETLWNNFVRAHPNISLVISGHQFEDFDQFKYHLDRGYAGNRVYELLVDPQNMANGGNGWIRLLEFDADGVTLHVKTFSPYLNQWDLAADNFYDIELSPITGDQFVFGDLNNDDVLDAADWAILRSRQHTSFAGLTPSQTYALGDLNGDLRNDHADFVLFKQAFEAALGVAAFRELLAQVPEPGVTTLAMTALLATAGARRRSRSS